MPKSKNGGIIGKKVTETAGMRSISKQGRDNGSVIGSKRLFYNLDDAVNKMGGIWNLSGIVPKSHGITTSYQSYYWVYPSAYQVFNTLGPGSTLTGTWNPSNDPACGGDQYGATGSPGQYATLASHSWTVIGCPWQWSGIIAEGSSYTTSYWVYPSPYQAQQTLYTTTYYTVWDYF